MKVTRLAIPEVVFLELNVFGDDRGFFYESFNQAQFETAISKQVAWRRAFETLAQDADNEYCMIDSTIVKAHQHSAGAKKRGLNNAKRSGAAVAA